MKKIALWTIALVAVLSLFVVVRGAMKAALMQEVSDAGMTLLCDTSDISDFEARLYEMAYSSPVAPDSVGLWLEAVLAVRFETFSTNGVELSREMAGRLRGWPLRYVYEMDLSGTPVNDVVFAELGPLDSLEWLDLSGTGVSENIVSLLQEQCPFLMKLQIRNTRILWNTELVDRLLEHPNLEDVEFVREKESLDDKLNRVREELDERE